MGSSLMRIPGAFTCPVARDSSIFFNRWMQIITRQSRALPPVLVRVRGFSFQRRSGSTSRFRATGDEAQRSAYLRPNADDYRATLDCNQNCKSQEPSDKRKYRTQRTRRRREITEKALFLKHAGKRSFLCFVSWREPFLVYALRLRTRL